MYSFSDSYRSSSLSRSRLRSYFPFLLMSPLCPALSGVSVHFSTTSSRFSRDTVTFRDFDLNLSSVCVLIFPRWTLAYQVSIFLCVSTWKRGISGLASAFCIIFLIIAFFLFCLLRRQFLDKFWIIEIYLIKSLFAISDSYVPLNSQSGTLQAETFKIYLICQGLPWEDMDAHRGDIQVKVTKSHCYHGRNDTKL